MRGTIAASGHNNYSAGYWALGRYKFWLAGLALLVLIVPATAHGLTTLSQGYTSTDKLAVGSIVSLKSTTSDEVNAATISNADSVFGVVINAGNSLLSLSSGQTNQIQVATSGVEQVLVSNINGDVADGDAVTASPISGVGMKATSNAKVIGIAQDSLSGRNGSTESYTDKQGVKHSIVLGEVPVLVNVAYYYKQPEKTIIPLAVQNIANALAGKPVNPLPILVSMAVFVVTLIVVVSIVYSMIRSSIISVGRNPMSQGAVYRDVIQLSALVIGILGVSVVAIYLILTRL